MMDITNGVVDQDQLLDELPDVHRETPHQDVDEDLVTDTTNVRETNRGVECILRYDRPHSIGHRPGERSHVKYTNQIQLRFVENLFGGGYLMIGPASKRNRVGSEVAEILGIAPDDYEHVPISSPSIARIVGEDSLDASFGWWRDIDSDTSSASVQGDIEDSVHAQDIDDDGRIVWVIFTSEQYGGKVGISTGSVVFYGNDWTHDRMENYIFDVVIPNLV